jgi:hypothetical protein
MEFNLNSDVMRIGPLSLPTTDAETLESQVVGSFAAVALASLVIHEQITSTLSSTPYISDCFLANLVIARSW